MLLKTPHVCGCAVKNVTLGDGWMGGWTTPGAINLPPLTQKRKVYDEYQPPPPKKNSIHTPNQVPPEHVVSVHDVPTTFRVPLLLKEQGLHLSVLERLRIPWVGGWVGVFVRVFGWGRCCFSWPASVRAPLPPPSVCVCLWVFGWVCVCLCVSRGVCDIM